MDLRSSCKPNIFGPRALVRDTWPKATRFPEYMDDSCGLCRGNDVEIFPTTAVRVHRAGWSGPERGLLELEAIPHSERLANYPFYHAAFGELELRRGKHETAREHLLGALALARNPMERQFLEQRIDACISAPAQNERRDQATRAWWKGAPRLGGL